MIHDTIPISLSLYIKFKRNFNFHITEESIQDSRSDRLTNEMLKDPTNVAKLRLKENVLERNLSPSLQTKY